MKLKLKWILTSACWFSASVGGAASKIVHSKTTNLELALNSNTVLCSSADYRRPMLKILIPELADLTVLNHRNTSADAPCVAAGFCDLLPGPHDRVDEILNDRPTEVVPVTVTLTRLTTPNEKTQECKVELFEDISLRVRGKNFAHRRSMEVQSRELGDCL